MIEKIPQADKNKVFGWFEAALAADKGINVTAIKNLGVATVGVRGYFEDTMGIADKNDVGMWDDACFLLDLKKNEMTAYSWNTDPSRLGHNSAIGKDYAILQPGIWLFHKGQHKMKGKAWRQPTADLMDGDPWGGKEFYNDWRKNGSFGIWRGQVGKKAETGYFAINIHWGTGSTSSWGCQTCPGTPTGGGQWGAFQKASYALATRSLMPYLLIDNPE